MFATPCLCCSGVLVYESRAVQKDTTTAAHAAGATHVPNWRDVRGDVTTTLHGTGAGRVPPTRAARVPTGDVKPEQHGSPQEGKALTHETTLNHSMVVRAGEPGLLTPDTARLTSVPARPRAPKPIGRARNSPSFFAMKSNVMSTTCAGARVGRDVRSRVCTSHGCCGPLGGAPRRKPALPVVPGRAMLFANGAPAADGLRSRAGRACRDAGMQAPEANPRGLGWPSSYPPQELQQRVEFLILQKSVTAMCSPNLQPRPAHANVWSTVSSCAAGERCARNKEDSDASQMAGGEN
jgi:hypothetical protein